MEDFDIVIRVHAETKDDAEAYAEEIVNDCILLGMDTENVDYIEHDVRWV